MLQSYLMSRYVVLPSPQLAHIGMYACIYVSSSVSQTDIDIGYRTYTTRAIHWHTTLACTNYWFLYRLDRASARFFYTLVDEHRKGL